MSDATAAGYLGCVVQIAAGASIPVVHPTELSDWATGGPTPATMERTVMIEVGSAGGSDPIPVAAKPQL